MKAMIALLLLCNTLRQYSGSGWKIQYGHSKSSSTDEDGNEHNQDGSYIGFNDFILGNKDVARKGLESLNSMRPIQNSFVSTSEGIQHPKNAADTDLDPECIETEEEKRIKFLYQNLGSSLRDQALEKVRNKNCKNNAKSDNEQSSDTASRAMDYKTVGYSAVLIYFIVVYAL